MATSLPIKFLMFCTLIFGSVYISAAYSETYRASGYGKDWIITTNEPESDKAIIAALENYHSRKSYDTNKFQIRHEQCSTEVLRQDEIYDNCLIDKLTPEATGYLRRSIMRSCERIACNPSVIDKLRY